MGGGGADPLPPGPAEELAVSALTWIAGQADIAAAFLDASGAAPEDLRTNAENPDFLGFVLDFLMADEAALLAFAADRGVPPTLPARARAGLPGGDLPHWT